MFRFLNTQSIKNHIFNTTFRNFISKDFLKILMIKIKGKDCFDHTSVIVKGMIKFKTMNIYVCMYVCKGYKKNQECRQTIKHTKKPN